MSMTTGDRITIDTYSSYLSEDTLGPFRNELWTLEIQEPGDTLIFDAGITFTVVLTSSMIAKSAVAAAAFYGLTKVADAVLSEMGKALWTAMCSGYRAVASRFRNYPAGQASNESRAINYFVGTDNDMDSAISFRIQEWNDSTPSKRDEDRILGQWRVLLATTALLTESYGKLAGRFVCYVGHVPEWTGYLTREGQSELLLTVFIKPDWTYDAQGLGDCREVFASVLKAERALH